MPDFWTHILCGHEVLERVDDCKYKKKIENDIKIFNLGTQGGDIFFYYKFWPWIKDRSGKEFANSIHTNNTGELFIKGLMYLKDYSMNEEEFNEIFSYISGFICHYALDSTAHPYIYYFSGKYDDSKPDTRQFIGWHKRLEVIIDTILLKKKKGIETYKYPAYREIYLGRNIPKSIENFFKLVMVKLYGHSTSINDSYRDMIKGMRIMYDPKGIKVKLLRNFEKVTGVNKNYSYAIYQKLNDIKADYLNDKRNQWRHPCDYEEIHYESFFDLYDKAVILGSKMLEAAINFIDGSIDLEGLREAFPSISYYTGKPIEVDCELKYFKLISE